MNLKEKQQLNSDLILHDAAIRVSQDAKWREKIVFLLRANGKHDGVGGICNYTQCPRSSTMPGPACLASDNFPCPIRKLAEEGVG